MSDQKLFCSKCEGSHYARGLCVKCYKKALASGEIEKKFNTRPKRDVENNVCSECSATKILLVKGLCRVCYNKAKAKSRYENNVEAMKEKSKAFTRNNPEKAKEIKLNSYHKHKEKRQAQVADYRIANREVLREKSRIKYQENKEYFKYKRLEWTYGLTPEEYDKMVADQDGCCAICKKKPDLLVVDHDHETGKVRQLLCSYCNSILGFIESRGPEVVLAARKYIEEHKENDNEAPRSV